MIGGVSTETWTLLHSSRQNAVAALVVSAYRLEGSDLHGFTDNEFVSDLVSTAIRFTRKGGPETRDDERERVVASIGAALIDAGVSAECLSKVTVRDLVPRKAEELKGEHAKQLRRKKVEAGVVEWLTSSGVDRPIAIELITKLVAQEEERVGSVKSVKDDLTLGEIVKVAKARAKRKMRRGITG